MPVRFRPGSLAALWSPILHTQASSESYALNFNNNSSFNHLPHWILLSHWIQSSLLFDAPVNTTTVRTKHFNYLSVIRITSPGNSSYQCFFPQPNYPCPALQINIFTFEKTCVFLVFFSLPVGGLPIFTIMLQIANSST